MTGLPGSKYSLNFTICPCSSRNGNSSGTCRFRRCSIETSLSCGGSRSAVGSMVNCPNAGEMQSNSITTTAPISPRLRISPPIIALTLVLHRALNSALTRLSALSFCSQHLFLLWPCCSHHVNGALNRDVNLALLWVHPAIAVELLFFGVSKLVQVRNVVGLQSRYRKRERRVAAHLFQLLVARHDRIRCLMTRVLTRSQIAEHSPNRNLNHKQAHTKNEQKHEHSAVTQVPRLVRHVFVPNSSSIENCVAIFHTPAPAPGSHADPAGLTAAATSSAERKVPAKIRRARLAPRRRASCNENVQRDREMQAR